MCPQKFLFYCGKTFFCVDWPEMVMNVRYLKKKSQRIWTNKVSNWSLLLQLLVGKKFRFFFKKFKFSHKIVFLMKFFFDKFCFLPTYMFGFIEWSLNWKHMITSINLVDKTRKFSIKNFNGDEKKLYLYFTMNLKKQKLQNVWQYNKICRGPSVPGSP